MALPWIIGGLAVATVAYLASDSDDDSSSSSSDRDDREREAIERAKEERNNRIHEDIAEYKREQKRQIKNKYNTIIDFISENSDKVDNLNYFNFNLGYYLNKDKVKIVSKDNKLENSIKKLKQKNKEIEDAQKELEGIRSEIFK